MNDQKETLLNERVKFQQKLLSSASKLLVLYELIVDLPQMLIFGGDQHSYISRTCFCFVTAFASMTFLKGERNLRLIPYILIVLYLFFSVSEIEILRSALNAGNSTTEHEFTLQTIFILVHFFKLRWHQAALLHGALIIYKLMRIFPKDWCFGLPYFKLFMIMSPLIILSYYQEKSELKKEELLGKTKNQNSFYQKFINNYIPNPLVIAGLNERGDESIFCTNQAMNQLADVVDKRDALTYLNCLTFKHAGKEEIGEHRININRKSCKNFTALLKELLTSPKEAEAQYFEYQAKLLDGSSSSKNLKSLICAEEYKNKTISKEILSQNSIPGEYENSKIDKDFTLLEERDSDYIVEKFYETNFLKEKMKAKKRRFEVKACVLRWENEPAVLFVFGQNSNSFTSSDIKAEMKMNKEKEKILASISHKINTHLNNIVFSLENAEKLTIHLDEIHENLTNSLRSAHLLSYSLRNLVDINKFEKKPLYTDEQSSYQVGPIIDEVLDLIKYQVKVKDLRILYDYDACRDVYIVCNQEYLKRILLNLLDNAIKYTNNGNSIKITAQIMLPQSYENPLGVLQNADGPGPGAELESNFVQFVVEDTGPGISAKKLGTLFSLFEREANKDFNIEGVKTGLPLSQALLMSMIKPENMKKSLIKLRSIPGSGSKFAFMLPLCTTLNDKDKIKLKQFIRLPHSSSFDNSKRSSSFIKELEEKRKSGEVSKNIEKQEQSINILIADDDKINQIVLINYINKLGITKYETADDGNEAIRLTKEAAERSEPFNLILMDINMPNLDGYQASLEIMELHRKGIIPEVSIIAITANVAINHWEKCKACGMRAFLTKPVNRKLLRQEIEKQTGIKFITEEKD